jgi:phosphoserine/homoserine phosphotransferase
VKQTMVVLDMEGVLAPEIWIAIAERSGIEALRRTTRDEPDYDVLMRGRIELLNRHDLSLTMIQDVISGLDLLLGAREFLDDLRSLTQVMILSDTFEQFAEPLMRKLGWPTLMCHRLLIAQDQVIGYQLRIPDAKRAAVRAMQSLNYRVIAAGDSYNDTAMLEEADSGFLIHAPAQVKSDFPHLRSLESLEQLMVAIRSELEADQ